VSISKILCTGYVRKYPVYLSKDGAFGDLPGLLPNTRKRFIIADKKVIELFPELMDRLKADNGVVFPIVADEDHKTFGELERLCGKIFGLKPCRDDAIVAVGGGLVMNLAGLTASLVMRGIRFCHVPTTLTGQIDACIGSKQAVNFMGAKNWIGTYSDPELCYVNPGFLRTLEKREMNSQAIEGVKLCLATDRELFYETFGMLEGFHSLSTERLGEFVRRMISAKLAVLKKDLMEKDYGMCMLYGHTAGHAIEMLNHKSMNHGEAVGLGMLVAAKISNLLGISDDGLVRTHEEILSRLGLPKRIPSSTSISAIEEMLKYNKKNYSGKIPFILLRGVGEMAERDGNYFSIVPKETVREAIKALY
jgi:3-dehydroquinate synthase